jgi:hypothetical protein
MRFKKIPSFGLKNSFWDHRIGNPTAGNLTLLFPGISTKLFTRTTNECAIATKKYSIIMLLRVSVSFTPSSGISKPKYNELHKKVKVPLKHSHNCHQHRVLLICK